MPKAIIIDLDGTIANCEHRLHLIEGENKDWDKFFLKSFYDEVYEDVSDCLKSIAYGPFTSADDIIAITGRNEKYIAIYELWDMKKVSVGEGDGSVFFDTILCRPEGDRRPAHEVKQDLLNKYSNENPDVEFLFALDDDIEACEMYRRNGILALHVMRPTS